MLFVCSVAWLFLLGCLYQCKWLTGKTRLRNDLERVDGDVKPYSLTHSTSNINMQLYNGTVFLQNEWKFLFTISQSINQLIIWSAVHIITAAHIFETRSVMFDKSSATTARCQAKFFKSSQILAESFSATAISWLERNCLSQWIFLASPIFLLSYFKFQIIFANRNKRSQQVSLKSQR